MQAIAMGAFTGTWDNSVHNNDVTVTTATGFSGSGSGVRTVKLGTATYTLSSASATWTFSTTTNLTFTGNTGCNIVFTGTSGVRTFSGGGLSYGNVTLGASSGNGYLRVLGANTFASLAITAPTFVAFTTVTNTITSAFSWVGTSSSQIGMSSDSFSAPATIDAASGSTAQWSAFRDMTFTGSPVATSSFDLGDNSGITITAPSAGGGISRARTASGF